MHCVITKNQQTDVDSKGGGDKIIFSLQTFLDCVETVDVIGSNRLTPNSLTLPWHKPLYDKYLWKRIKYSLGILNLHGLLFVPKR